MRTKQKHKKGGVVSNTIMGVGGLIIGVIIAFVIIQTLLGSNLLNAGDLNNTVTDMSLNYTAGVNEVSSKIPTILLIVAVVFLFGALILLVRNSRAMGVGGGGSL